MNPTIPRKIDGRIVFTFGNDCARKLTPATSGGGLVCCTGLNIGSVRHYKLLKVGEHTFACIVR